MGQTAQQFQLRPAPFVATPPQPRLIRGQQRNAPLANAVEQEQWLFLGPGHQNLRLRGGRHVDLAKPTAPTRTIPSRGRLRKCLQPLSHRMALAHVGQLWGEPLFNHPRSRRTGQDIPKARAIDTVGCRIFRASRDQHRTTVIHIPGDIVEIFRWQNSPPTIAVKDDQIEIVDLFNEQLAGRKGDQRQFFDRNPVQLIWWAQNGKMHEVNRAV